MQSHDLDQAADLVTDHVLDSIAQHSSARGVAAPHIDRNQLRTALRGTITHEMGGGTPSGAQAAPGAQHAFNFANFAKNLNAFLPLISAIVTAFTKIPITIPPIPTGSMPTDPSAPIPAS